MLISIHELTLTCKNSKKIALNSREVGVNNKYENDNSNNMPTELCRFELNTDFADNQNVKNVIMCRIYRKYENSGWIFNAIGKNGLNGNAMDYDPIVEEIASILKKELKEYNKYLDRNLSHI